MKLKINRWKKDETTLSIIDRSCQHRYNKAIPTFAAMVRKLNKA